MARITLYSSQATETTEGLPVSTIDRWPVSLGAVSSEAESGRSAAARLIGIQSDVRFVSYEFFTIMSSVQDVIYLRWWQEFYSDNASPFLSPTGDEAIRRPGQTGFAGVTSANWMREVALVDGGLGNLDMYPITRRMTITPQPYTALNVPNPTPPPDTIPNSTPFQSSLHIPLAVNANWARIAFWVDYELSAISDPELFQLYIMAHVGGHSEFEYLENPTKVGLPYTYDAYRNRPLPQGAKVIKPGGAV